MTWIVGATTMFGYSVLLSDVRVTWKRAHGEHVHRDALQKAVLVGDSVVAGFSGSVAIGFSLLENLVDFIAAEQCGDGQRLRLHWIVEHWKHDARRIFHHARPEERRLGSALLLASAEPAPMDQSFYGSRPVLVVQRAPRYEPEVVTALHQARHIGTGSMVEDYQQALLGCLRPDNMAMLTGEEMGPGGFGHMLASSMRLVALRNPVDDVSPHMHGFVVSHGKVFSFANDMKEFRADGTVRPFTMPADVARNRREFEERYGGEALTDASASSDPARSQCAGTARHKVSA